MNEAPTARRAAVFQDLSGVGRCALAVAMPVLSVMNVQPCPIPTAVLSAHTAFPSVVMQDLTSYMRDAIGYWIQRDFIFDAILSGYLADENQAALIGGFIDSQRAKGAPFVLIDPAMADHGRLYSGLKASMPDTMRALCARADLITPNLTEAALLTETPMRKSPLSEGEAALLLKGLLSLGCIGALITGVPMENGKTANLCATKPDGVYHRVSYMPLDAAYPGTGDLFAAVLLGGLLNGEALPLSMARATAFTYRAIERTAKLNTPQREGVQFEALLSDLPDMYPFAIETVAL